MFEGSFGLVLCDDDLNVSGMLGSNRSRLAKQGVQGVLYVVMQCDMCELMFHYLEASVTVYVGH